MFSYGAFDLGIHSALALPELVARTPVSPDVVVRLGPVDPPRIEAPVENCIHLTAHDAYFAWDQFARFRARDGSEIVVQPVDGVEQELVRLPLLGVVLATLLHQRGLLVLHASAVAIGGRAVAFLGAKGAGKSTTAAALYARGHTLLGDDVVALDDAATGPRMVLPGSPQLKLWPDAATSSLGQDPDALPRIASMYEKRSRLAEERFASRPLPLGALFVLDYGDELELEYLSPHEAMKHLIANTYVARFGARLLSGPAAAGHLKQIADLVRDTPLYRLRRPVSLPELPSLTRLIEDVAQGQPGVAA
jgi:hypothetical protein